MKHIYIFITQCKASNYGVGTYTEQLVQFIRGNYNLTLVYLNTDKNEFMCVHDEKGIRYIYIPQCVGSRYIENSQFAYLYYQAVWFLISPYISKNENNIFHFQYTHVLPLVSMIKEQLSESKIVLTLHYMEWAFALKGNKQQLIDIINQPPESLSGKERIVYDSFCKSKNLFMLVDKTICLCSYAYRLLNEIFDIPSYKLSFIANGLKDKEQNTISKNKIMHLFPHEKIILFVGRLDENKGLTYLLKAFRLLTNKYTNLRLVIVGDGDYNWCLKECYGIWNCVSFTGVIDRQSLYKLYNIAEMGILPSINEQCSYVVIEMFRHALPVVGTDSTGLSEMIVDGINGYKVKVSSDGSLSPLELAEKIERCLNNSNLSEGARNTFTEKYSAELMFMKYQEMYNKL